MPDTKTAAAPVKKSGFNPMTFLTHNKNTIDLIAAESSAILASGATGAHAEQARRNLFMSQALFGVLSMLAHSHDQTTPSTDTLTPPSLLTSAVG